MRESKPSILLWLTCVLTLAFNVQPVTASFDYIIIDPNGAVWATPENKDKIGREGNVYTFIGDISCDGIQVGKSDITINGNGHTLQGAGQGVEQRNGFWLLPNINNVKIQNTNIKNFHWGILLESYNGNNIIRRNTIAACHRGIFMSVACSDNEFYHNNFIGNTTQAEIVIPCGDCNNIWDNDYPSGGNYWSDYVMVDDNSGPAQDQPKSDGIWDVNYPIDTDNIDWFPLVNPYLLSVRNIETGSAYYTIQQAVDDASPGDMIRVSSGKNYEGTYYQQPYYEAVDVNKPLWLAGDSNAIIDAVRNGSDVVKITANNTHLEGFIIQNAGDANCGINLNGVQFNNIIGNTITDNLNGIGLYNGANYNAIIDSNITSNANVGIDINDSDNIFISRNTVNLNSGLSIVIQDANDTEVVKNTLASNSGGGIHIKGYSYNNEIRGNEIASYSTDSNGILIEAIGDANTTVTSNTVTSNRLGIVLRDTSYNEVSDNNVVSNALSGLWLKNAPNSTIENNVIKSNGEAGISVNSSDTCSIIGNKISDHLYEWYNNGILLETSNDCNIIGNKIFNNYDNIYMYDASYCNIIDNSLTLAQSHGLRIEVSNSNVISKNQIMDNGSCGIYVDSSENNTIYHNIFVNNFQYNALVTFTGIHNNYWDNGYPYPCEPNYPTGGNFWSDYTNYVDANNGPNQDLPGGDYDVGCTKYGIADTAFSIQDGFPNDSNNIDRYPIMLTSYKVTKPNRPKIKKPYTLTVEFTNDTNDLFEGGLVIDINGIEQVPPPHPSSVRWDWDLDYNIETYALPEPCNIPIDKTPVVLTHKFTNNWNWVKPEDWRCIVIDFALGCVSIPHATICFIRSAFDAGMAVPSLTYTFGPYRSPFVSFTTDVTVDTPVEKHTSLHGSLVAQLNSIICSIASAVCSFWNPPAATALAIEAAVFSAESVVFYHLAVDPDPNYTVIAELIHISAPNDVDDLSEGSIEKRIALAAMDLASLEQAYELSYIRYDAAREDSNDTYMGQQLAAALKYNAMAIRKLQELQFLNAVLIVDIPTPTNQDVNDFRDDIDANGLPEAQYLILEQTVFEPGNPNEPNEADIIEVMLALTDPGDPNAAEMRELCKDPNNLHKYTQIVLNAYYIQNYALQAMIEEENFTPFIEARYPDDIAVTDVWPAPARAFIGENVVINVEVENHGIGLATFDVNAYIDTNSLGTETVNDLAPGEKRTLTFDWDTTDVNVGYYIIGGQATLPGVNDNFPADNNYTGRVVSVMQDLDRDRIPDTEDNCLDTYNPGQADRNQDGWGDRCECIAANGGNDSGHVDLGDFAILSLSWKQSGPTTPGDINSDGVVDLNDLEIFAYYWLSDCCTQ